MSVSPPAPRAGARSPASLGFPKPVHSHSPRLRRREGDQSEHRGNFETTAHPRVGLQPRVNARLARETAEIALDPRVRATWLKDDVRRVLAARFAGALRAK